MRSLIRESRRNTARRGDRMGQASKIKNQYKKRTLFQETWRRLVKNRGAMLGLGFLVLLVLAAALSPVIFGCYRAEHAGSADGTLCGSLVRHR